MKLEVLLHETLPVSLTSTQNVVAGEIKHGKKCKSTKKTVVEMPELHSRIEEADAGIALHVANSLKYNVDRVIVYSPDLVQTAILDCCCFRPNTTCIF